jgi:hypothetical protein
MLYISLLSRNTLIRDRINIQKKSCIALRILISKTFSLHEFSGFSTFDLENFKISILFSLPRHFGRPDGQWKNRPSEHVAQPLPLGGRQSRLNGQNSITTANLTRRRFQSGQGPTVRHIRRQRTAPRRCRLFGARYQPRVPHAGRSATFRCGRNNSHGREQSNRVHNAGRSWPEHGLLYGFGQVH